MQVSYLWRIADFMKVKPSQLLAHDKNGLLDFDDLDRINFGRTDYEIKIENESINDLVQSIRDLNPSGLEELDRIVSLLREIPRLRKQENEYYDGSPDYWKKHPYQKRVTPYDEEEDHTDGQS